MRPVIFLIPAVLFVALIFPAHSLPVVPIGSAPTTGQTIFFDDFTGTGLSPQVTTQFPQTQAFVSEAGSFLYMTPNSTLPGGPPGQSFVQVIANSSNAQAFGTLKPESVQFVQIVFRLQAFNATNPAPAASGPSLLFNDQIGLSDPGVVGAFRVYFSIYESVQNLNTLPFTLNNGGGIFPAAKSAIFLNINKPMGSTTTSDYTESYAVGNNPGILYNPPNVQIDPNILHTYTIQMQIDNGTAANNYVRFQVDNNGWMGYNQVACNCVTGPSGDILTLYPTMNIINRASVSATMNQRVALQTDYILMTNYVPAQLPQGTLLNCSTVNGCIIQSKGVPQPTFGGGTATIGQFMQQEALSLDHTNIYSGGLALTGIISTIALVGFGMAAAKARLSVRIFGFVYVLFVTVLSIFGYIVSIVPIWLPIVTVSLVIAMFAGVIRGVPAGGGVVPD